MRKVFVEQPRLHQVCGNNMCFYVQSFWLGWKSRTWHSQISFEITCPFSFSILSILSDICWDTIHNICLLRFCPIFKQKAFLLYILEDTARYAGLLLAPAESFGRGFFCPSGTKSKNPLKKKTQKTVKNGHKIQKSWKISKNHLFSTKKIFRKKKNVILLVLPIEEIRLWPELSSPPRFRIQGG